MKHTITSCVNDGKLEPWKGKALVNIIGKFEGEFIEITVTKHYSKISDKQNRFLHGVFLPALLAKRREAGEILTAEEVRNDFKNMFGPIGEPYKNGDGQWVCQPKSVSEWTTKETEDAMEACRGHYGEWFDLPLPDSNLTTETTKGE